MKRLLIILCATLCGLAAVGQEWASSQPGYHFAFPRDHGPHPDYKTEWWYYTGNLETAQGRHFAYQFTIFRIGLAPETVFGGKNGLYFNVFGKERINQMGFAY